MKGDRVTVVVEDQAERVAELLDESGATSALLVLDEVGASPANTDSLLLLPDDRPVFGGAIGVCGGDIGRVASGKPDRTMATVSAVSFWVRSTIKFLVSIRFSSVMMDKVLLGMPRSLHHSVSGSKLGMLPPWPVEDAVGRPSCGVCRPGLSAV